MHAAPKTGRVRGPRASLAALAAVGAVVLAGCGSVEVKSDGSSTTSDSPSASPSPTAAAVDTTQAAGNWLLGMTTAGGADGEASTTTYVTYDPSTGAASKVELPSVRTPSVAPEEQSLLVSADRRWAIPDTLVPRALEKSGKLEVFSLDGSSNAIIDINQRAGTPVGAIGWAFDPTKPDTLRVVDTKNRVWVTSVAGTKATRAGSIAHGQWVFTNGFNRNTGQPYVTSVTSEKSNPAGNGAEDTSPIMRDGGTLLPSGSQALEKLPASPCRLGAAWVGADGTTWEFCADQPSVSAYYLAKDGQQWTAFGKPSAPVAPVSAGFPVVLPPAT